MGTLPAWTESELLEPCTPINAPPGILLQQQLSGFPDQGSAVLGLSGTLAEGMMCTDCLQVGCALLGHCQVACCSPPAADHVEARDVCVPALCKVLGSWHAA